MSEKKEKKDYKAAAKEVLNKSKAAFDKAREDLSDKSKETAEKAKESLKKAKETANEKSKAALNKTRESFNETKDAIAAKMDVNGDGQFGIEDIVILSLKSPGVYIKRKTFLKNQFFKNHPEDVVNDIIERTPAKAGIMPDEIDKLVDEAIKSERVKVSGISTALSLPGGASMAATIPADIVQYYGFMLRAAQKMLYLYGFPDVDADAEEGIQLDDQTMNTIILCLGVMYGVAGANNAIKAVANALSKGVSNKLMSMALTKGTIYPFVKSISKWFGIRLTKKMFSEAIGKAIPVVGGVVGGGLTFFSFKPCCDRLKDALKDTMLANPVHAATEEEKTILDSMMNGEVFEGEFEEITFQEEDTEEE